MIRFFVLALAIWISTAAGQSSTSSPVTESPVVPIPTNTTRPPPGTFTTTSTRPPPGNFTTTFNPFNTTFINRGIHFGTGFTYSVCGYEYARNITYVECPPGQPGLTTTWVISFPTKLGYNSVATLQILLCSPNAYTCYNACDLAEDFVGPDVNVTRCSADCCHYDYCYSYHYKYSSPPYFNIPKEDLLDAKVEILPNCTLQDLAPRAKSCISPIFEAWPFYSTNSCVVTLLDAIKCGAAALSTCKSNKRFTSSLIPVPQGFEISGDLIQNLTEPITNLLLKPICSGENPLESLLTQGNMSLDILPGGFGGFGGFGSPQFCQFYFMSRVAEWAKDFLEVLQTTTNRTVMCGAFKRVVYNLQNISNDVCNVSETIHDTFRCDSIKRNQLRALSMQLRHFIPELLPDYCSGIPPLPVPQPPSPPRDMPFLPSCTLRKTVSHAWTCESIFTKSTPYDSPDACKTNVNRLMNCVANRLEECAYGDGPNAFDTILHTINRYRYPNSFKQLISAIRFQARPVDNNRWDPRNMFCSSANLNYLSTYDPTNGFLSAMCGKDIYKQLIDRVKRLYYEYVGARNSADICKAYRSMREWVTYTARNKCDFKLLTYLVSDSSKRYILRNFAHILTDVLDDLEISACPVRPADNNTLLATDWLRSYVKWRTTALPKWRSAFYKYLAASGQDVEDFEIPPCSGFFEVPCRNEGMQVCNTDDFRCGFCYCQDHKYRDLAGKLFRKWQEDYQRWYDFFTKWEEAFEDFSDLY